jgi:excinuclease ABC subunit C
MPDVVSIAKADEARGEKADKIYVPGRKNPVSLASDHPVLLLMMRIRDEAHRRAITFHRRLRRKGMTASDLDRIPGIGARRKGLLLRHFRDITAVARAGTKDLAGVPGISPALAERIFSFFHEPVE